MDGFVGVDEVAAVSSLGRDDVASMKAEVTAILQCVQQLTAKVSMMEAEMVVLNSHNTPRHSTGQAPADATTLLSPSQVQPQTNPSGGHRASNSVGLASLPSDLE